MLSADEFESIEAQLFERRWAYMTRPIKQPLIRLWDKNMDQIAQIVLQESWDCEEIAHDNGQANIEIVGKDNDWLREIVLYDTRPAEDLHITIDPDPDKPHDWRNRWGGKVVTISDDEERGQPNHTVLHCISNRRHLQHIYLAATPIFPMEVQPLKMFLWGGPCVTTLATSTWINLFRIYTLNGFFPIPRNVFAPETWLENVSPLNWPVQVMPVNPIFDQSRWTTIAARWKDCQTVFTPVMKDCGVICHAYTWLKGDPAPYTMFGPLANALKPTRSCVILSFEDQSGVSGPTGTAFDGLVNLIAATGDDLITEALLPIDGDGDGETDPFIRKILGVAPKRPPWVYRDVGYGGVQARKMVVHKTGATDIIVGGRSPVWVNQAITYAIRYGLAQLAQVISTGIGAAYGQPLAEGLDNLYQGQLDDVFLAFMRFTDPIRSAAAGPYAFREHFQQGSGTAYTVSSIQDIRAGHYATRPYVTMQFDVGDGAPFVLGEDIRLGSRVSAELRGILYTDQILAIRREGSRTKSGRPQLSFGDDSREEDQMARGFATLANVSNFLALFAAGADVF